MSKKLARMAHLIREIAVFLVPVLTVVKLLIEIANIFVRFLATVNSVFLSSVFGASFHEPNESLLRSRGRGARP